MDFVSIVTVISNLISKIVGSKDELQKQAYLLELQTKLGELQLSAKQIDVNIEQAKNPSLFVSGPRPFIMWGLGGVLVLWFLLSAGLGFAQALGYHVMVMPVLDPMMRDIILGLLGLGYLSRSYEKVKGIK